MQKRHNFFGLLIFIFSLSLISLAFISCKKEAGKNDDGLYVDFDEARNYAGKNKQNVLLIVTMEGDDISSKAFMDDVVRQPDFKTEILQKFTTVHFDFSQTTYQQTISHVDASKSENKIAQQKAERMQYNSQVATMLDVRVTPSAFILSEDGYFISEVLIPESIKNPKDFSELLSNYSATVKSFNELFAKAKNGTSIDKVHAIDEIFEKTEINHRGLLSELIKDVPELDKTDRTGLVGKYLLAIAENEALELYQNGDVVGAIQSYTKVASQKALSPEYKQQAYYMAGYLLISTGSNDFDVILDYFRKSAEAAPESEAAPGIKNIIDYILTIQAEVAAETEAANAEVQRNAEAMANNTDIFGIGENNQETSDSENEE